MTPPPFPMRRSCPYAPPDAYAPLRAEGALHEVRLPTGRTAWVVTRYDDVRRLLADPRVSSDIRHPNFPALGAGEQEAGARSRPFIRTDPPEHSRYRRMFLAEFTARRVAAMRPAVEDIVDAKLDDLLARGSPDDLVAHFANAVSTTTICQLIGLPTSDPEFFRDVTRITGGRKSSAQEVTAALGRLFAMIGDHIAQRERNPGDDLLSKLVTNHLLTGVVNRQELISSVAITLIGGRETTTSMITLSALVLLEQPALLDQLRTDPELVPAAVEELLRVLSVADSLPLRVATTDLEVSGHLIREGDGVICLLAAANHDPDAFPDPQRIDFHRQGRQHLAFGHGAHACFGQSLARLEVEIALATLVRRVPTLRLASPMAEIELKHESATFGVEKMLVSW